MIMRRFKNLRDFYSSREWESFRQLVIAERIGSDGVLHDEYTGKPLFNAYDIILHHKIPLTEANVNDVTISLNPENIMIVSFRSHNEIHARFGYEMPRCVYLVYGAPCSGKSSWVADNATSNDLVVDMDKIWQMISINPKYTKPNRLKANVFGVRDYLLDMVMTRAGKWQQAFIVGGYPLYMDRERLCTKLDATPIFIDTPKDICLTRALDRPGEWKKYVEDWFNSFVPSPQGNYC